MVYPAGIIFEGGGMREAYTAGVIDALIENDIICEKCYGISSGACHATSYISRQTGRSLRGITDHIDDKRYCSFKSFITTGNLFGVKMIFDIIPHELDKYDFETARTTPTQFYACVTNCRNGKAEFLHVKDVEKEPEYMKVAASMALPFIARVVKINGKRYLDGGVADSLPVQKAFDDGNKKLILVLTQAQPYQKKFNWLTPLVAIRYLIYPKYTAAFATRHIRYNESLKLIEKEEKAGNVFIFRPKEPVTIGRLEVDRTKINDLYEIGYREANELMPALKKFLGEP